MILLLSIREIFKSSYSLLNVLKTLHGKNSSGFQDLFVRYWCVCRNPSFQATGCNQGTWEQAPVFTHLLIFKLNTSG